MKNRQSRIVLTVLMVCSVFVGLEVLSLGYYGLTRHKLYYSDQARDQSGIPQNLQVAEAVFHPYFSFINRVGRSGPTYGTNNHGWQFTSTLIEENPLCCDYPTHRNSNEVIVGIFGGSVGSGFALAAQTSTDFIDRLASIPRFAGKKITILNFAMSGFHQPQQLITLAYYLSLGQQFDLVVNIDGFNEVVTSSRNWETRVDPTYPADTVWGEMGRQVERANLPLDSSQHLLSAYHERMAVDLRHQAEQCMLAMCFALTQVAEYYHAYRHKDLFQAVLPETDAVSLFPVTHRYTFGSDIDIFSYTADRWADSSLSMARLLRGSGALYLHVLQPNQWFRKSGNYEPIEPGHIYEWIIDPVNLGYAALLDRVPQLRDSGVHVLDATMVFRNINQGVYLDDCCHYTKEGNKVLFHAVAKEIKRLIQDEH